MRRASPRSCSGGMLGHGSSGSRLVPAAAYRREGRILIKGGSRLAPPSPRCWGGCPAGGASPPLSGDVSAICPDVSGRCLVRGVDRAPALATRVPVSWVREDDGALASVARAADVSQLPP